MLFFININILINVYTGYYLYTKYTHQYLHKNV